MTLHEHTPTGSRPKVRQLSVHTSRTSIPRSPVLSIVFKLQRYGTTSTKTYLPLQKAHPDPLLASPNRTRRFNNSYILLPTLRFEFRRVCPSLFPPLTKITNKPQQTPHPSNNLPPRSHPHHCGDHTTPLPFPKTNHIPAHPVWENGYLGRYASIRYYPHYLLAG